MAGQTRHVRWRHRGWHGHVENRSLLFWKKWCNLITNRGKQSMPGFTLATDPEVVLWALRPLLIPVYEALETSIPRAIQIVAENGWEKSGHLTSHITRAEAKKFLKDRACPIEFDEIERRLEMDQVAMEGLATTFDGINIKVLKGSEIPKATTEPRRTFYQHANPGFWVGGVVPPIKSLIVLWNCSDSGQNLVVQLCCTKDQHAEDYWMTTVPHPASWMIAPQPSAPLSDNLDDLFDEGDATGEQTKS
jgi:hypothetical protein